jgi:hypothetical protein
MQNKHALSSLDGASQHDGLSDADSENFKPIYGFTVRPRRPINTDDITEALNWYAPPFRIGDAIELGFKLTCWRDLMPSATAWQSWLAVNLPQIPGDEVAVYCRLYQSFWDNGLCHRLYDGNATCVTEAFQQLTDERKRLSTPAKKEHTRRRKCAECRSLFVPKRSDAKFCSQKCQKRAIRRARLLEGAQRVRDNFSVTREAALGLDSQTAKNTECAFGYFAPSTVKLEQTELVLTEVSMAEVVR